MSSHEWDQSYTRPLEVVLPEDLQGKPEVIDWFDRIMYGLGSRDTKAPILLHGLSREPKGRQQILDQLEDTLPKGTRIPSYSSLQNTYLARSFCPTGIVVEHYDRRAMYATSAAGEGFVKDIVALYLKYADKIQRPISQVMGNTAIGGYGGRSHISRTTLLILLAQGDTYVSEAERKTGLEKTIIGKHFAKLGELGLVEYDFADTEKKGWGVYERVGDLDKVFHSHDGNRLRRNIVEYFRVNVVGNPQTIAKALGRADEIDIWRILSELTEAEVLKRSQWYGGVQQSDARITSQGRQFVEEFILPILYACAGDSETLSSLRAVRDHIEANPAISARVIDLQQSFTQLRLRYETAEEILAQIAQNGPMRPMQLIDALGQRAAPILSELYYSGRLTAQGIGRATYYMLPDMEPPGRKDEIIIFDYNKPENLLPPTCLPKEAYREVLGTKEFWEALAADVQAVEQGVLTERYFFYFYNPQNPNWRQIGDYRVGKYHHIVNALRGLGIRDPYQFLREFRPSSKDNDLFSVISQAQQAIRDQLVETVARKTWDEYLAELHLPQFWEQLYTDIQHIIPGTTMNQFLLYFASGKYANIYAVTRDHFANGTTFLRDFTPTQTVPQEVERAIRKAQRAIKEKFVFPTTRIKPEDWIERFATPAFWEELKDDLLKYSGETTFGNFIFAFSNNNKAAERRPSEDPTYLGKYYRILITLSHHPDIFLNMPEMADLPKYLGTLDIVRWFTYRKAPEDVRDILLAKFPVDFRPIDDTYIQKDEPDTPTRLSHTLPIENLPKEIIDVVRKVDALAQTSLRDKMAIMVFALWEGDPSPKNIQKMCEALNITQRNVYEYTNYVIGDLQIEKVWDRYLDFPAGL